MFEHGDFIPLISGIKFDQQITALDLFTFVMMHLDDFGTDKSFKVIFPDADHGSAAGHGIIHTAEAHDQNDRKNQKQNRNNYPTEYPKTVAHRRMSVEKIFPFPFHFQFPLFILLWV